MKYSRACGGLSVRMTVPIDMKKLDLFDQLSVHDMVAYFSTNPNVAADPTIY